jgi:hypothetical protein
MLDGLGGFAAVTTTRRRDDHDVLITGYSCC